MEKIKSAAIQYRDHTGTLHVVTGPNHAYCINIFSFLEIPVRDRLDEVQGFVTTLNRFVDRTEALQIAKSANQLYNPDSTKTWLDSYDINWSKGV